VSRPHRDKARAEHENVALHHELALTADPIVPPVEPSDGFDDNVLPADEAQQVRGATARIGPVIAAPDDAMPRGSIYTQLPDELADEARKLARDFRSSQSDVVEVMIKMGRRFAEIKKALRGNFLRWIDEECPRSKRTVAYYMKFARFAAEAGVRDEFATVANLSRATVALLTSKNTPVETRREIVDQFKAGELPTDRSLRLRIQKEQEAARAATDPSAQERQREDAENRLRRKESEAKAERLRVAEALIALAEKGLPRSKFLSLLMRTDMESLKAKSANPADGG
jgi:hypothetical protein